MESWNNEKAVKAFAAHSNEAAAKLQTILDFVREDHMGVTPEDVDWAWVGNAAYLNQGLTEIMITLGLADEER